MKKTLYLIRHGQASAGTFDYDRLSSLGITQSRMLGEHMLEQDLLPEEIWVGNLLRQRQTAEHYKEATGLELPLQIDSRFNEYDHKAVHRVFHPHAHTRKTAPASDEPDLAVDMSFETYTQIIHNWAAQQQINHHDIEGNSVESWHAFKHRCLSAILEIFNNSRASKIAVFTSGGVISVIAGQLQQHSDKHIPKLIWELNNASINTIHYQDDEPRLHDLNQVPHLIEDESLITQI